MYAKVLDLGLVSVSLGFCLFWWGVLGVFMLLSAEKSSLFWFLEKSTNGSIGCSRGTILGFLGCVLFSFCGFWALVSSIFFFVFLPVMLNACFFPFWAHFNVEDFLAVFKCLFFPLSSASSAWMSFWVLLVMSEPIFTIFEHFDMEGLVDYLFFMLKT